MRKINNTSVAIVVPNPFSKQTHNGIYTGDIVIVVSWSTMQQGHSPISCLMIIVLKPDNFMYEESVSIPLNRSASWVGHAS